MPNLNAQKPQKVSEITVDRILSHYLWNSPTPPLRENMPASVTYAERNPIVIDAVDYMKNGGGRYASAADFKMFENFFNTKNLPVREKSYSFDEVGRAIYGVRFDNLKKDFENPDKGFTTSVSQYGLDITSRDYTERAFIFGSTQVTVTKADIEKLRFVVHPDGSREIRNLRITPKDDNFDFKGGPSSSDWADRMKKWGIDRVNDAFKATLDPKNIGRTVDFKYAGTENLPFTNITDTEFKRLQHEKIRKALSDAVIEKTGIPFVTKSSDLMGKLMNSPALYDKSPLKQLKDFLDDTGEMYRKTREIIDKDPNMMSQNEGEQPPYAQTDIVRRSSEERFRYLIEGFKNDTDGSFAKKALAENKDVVEAFWQRVEARMEERAAEQRQEQEMERQQELERQMAQSPSRGRGFGFS